MKRRFRGQTLIGLLVVVAIIMVMFVMYFGPRQGKDGKKEKSIVAGSFDKAKGVELASNLANIQNIIGLYRQDNEGRVPASLEELKRYAKFPEEMWINPVNKEPLVYDPATGTISAPGMKKPNAAGVISSQDQVTPQNVPQNPQPQVQVPSMPGSPAIDVPMPGSSDSTDSE